MREVDRGKRSCAWDDGKREKRGASLLSFPFPAFPARFLPLSPASALPARPMSTKEARQGAQKKPLWRREREQQNDQEM